MCERLFTVSATAVMRRLPDKTDGLSLWVGALLDRRPFRLVPLALADKMARIAWVVMVTGALQSFRNDRRGINSDTATLRKPADREGDTELMQIRSRPRIGRPDNGAGRQSPRS
jgi:hypothetical protein